MTISEYLDRKDRLTNTRFVITETGNGFFVEEGKMYTREEFRQKYPTPVSLAINNGINCDKTKSYLGTD